MKFYKFYTVLKNNVNLHNSKENNTLKGSKICLKANNFKRITINWVMQHNFYAILKCLDKIKPKVCKLLKFK